MAVILVVEDEKDIREGIVELLQKEHQVFQAATGKEALDMVDKEGLHTNIVLLDIVLPDMNGIEILKKIKATYLHLNVIMVTVFKDVATAVKCLQEGAYDYVTKPFIPEDLLATIKRALEKDEIERDFRFYSDRIEKMNLDFERRKILFQEIKMKRKLEGKDLSIQEYAKIMHPAQEKRLESKPWEEWENELQKGIKIQPPAEKPVEINILVIEDEKDIRDGMLEVLKKDYLPTGAGSAEEALSLIKNKKFDVILLDVILPDRSGMDLLPEIMKQSPKSHVIMVTVLKDIHTAISAMKLGAYDYVTKPFVVEELLAVINRAASIVSTKARIRQMIEQMEKERLPEELRKELFQTLMEKLKKEGKELQLDDVFAFFPDLRGDWAEKEWSYPLDAVEKIGIDEMIKRFREQKRRWEDMILRGYKT